MRDLTFQANRLRADADICTMSAAVIRHEVDLLDAKGRHEDARRIEAVAEEREAEAMELCLLARELERQRKAAADLFVIAA